MTAANPKLNLGTALLPAEAEELAAAGVAEPGLACSQQMHFAREMSFWAMHVSQSQFWAFCLATSCWNPESALGGSAAPNFRVGPPLLEPLLILMADGVEEETDDDDELELELVLELETAPSLLVLLGLWFAFRLGTWQATHSVALAWFTTKHVWHSHVLALGLKAAPNPEPDSGATVFDGGWGAVFRGVSQATHLVASCLLESMQASHSQALDDFLKRSPKPLVMGTIPGKGAATIVGGAGLAPGFGDSQATHLEASDLFRTMHISHSHSEADFLNCSPNPLMAGAAGALAGALSSTSSSSSSSSEEADDDESSDESSGSASERPAGAGKWKLRLSLMTLFLRRTTALWSSSSGVGLGKLNCRLMMGLALDEALPFSVTFDDGAGLAWTRTSLKLDSGFAELLLGS